CMQGIQFPRTF
nr:immunoglobulin light chain junction region [Macaca mulatta]MPN87558.1 immunoglobulin light chain junction region [Macaca mulatta]MPN87647.1 immunoglobulin light chain junction region [Macaca mulatta]MPN88230.1 immunoglobulin light chain junction region [Macaca mulatta]MPN88954.1 immunoglobulin light chain junction region [Macaca mulatta]